MYCFWNNVAGLILIHRIYSQAAEQLAAVNETASQAERASGMEERLLTVSKEASSASCLTQFRNVEIMAILGPFQPVPGRS